MINKCMGCGATFQCEDPKKEGYVASCDYEKVSLCKRCFRIKNYGDYQVINKDSNDYKIIFDEIKAKNKLILFLCDILTIDNSLEQLNYFKGNVILIITKKDLLPKSVKEGKILNYISKNFNLNVIDTLFVSSVKNYNLDHLMNLIEKYKVDNKVYVVGNTNAGKSTLINSIAKSYSNKNANITSSILPATTIDLIYVKLNDELTLIDTPGIVYSDNYLFGESPKEIKIITPKVEIKPRTYQIKPNQSLIIGNYARIDYLGEEKNSFTLYLSNNIKVKRINLKTNNVLKELKKHEFSVSKARDIVINGLCFCKIVNDAKLSVYVKNGVRVYQRPNLI